MWILSVFVCLVQAVCHISCRMKMVDVNWIGDKFTFNTGDLVPLTKIKIQNCEHLAN